MYTQLNELFGCQSDFSEFVIKPHQIKLFLTISRPSAIYIQIFIPSLHQNFVRQYVTLVKINGPQNKPKGRAVDMKSSVIWQKGESQNGSNKNTKHAKFSEKRTFFTPWYAHVRIRYFLLIWQKGESQNGGNKNTQEYKACQIFRKINVFYPLIRTKHLILPSLSQVKPKYFW